MSGGRHFAPLPPGARDLLPPILRSRAGLTRRLLEVFERWGYDAVATPAVEYFHVFARGLTEAERQRCVRFFAPGSAEVVTLRSDVTPQIARLVGQHCRERLDAGECLRLCYAADVIGVPDHVEGAAEEHQVGVELIGDGSPAADAELIALGAEALAAAGVSEVVFDLAHVGVARALLDALGLRDDDRQAVIQRMARKDLAGLAALLEGAGVERGAGEGLLELARLHGPTSTLDRARALPSIERTPAIRDALGELQAVVDALRGLAPEVAARLSVDLGEVRGHDYYSGLRVRAWARGSARPLIRGGRYDALLRRYGVSAPATGLAVHLEALEGLVGADLDAPAPATLVALAADAGAAPRAAADRLARSLRSTGRRAWVEPNLSLETAKRTAARAGADTILRLDRDEVVTRLCLVDAVWVDAAAPVDAERREHEP
ncbi:MAG: ATP phosphoribosyltransferase regulatory subunit [Nannocystaceae bacterium]